MLNFRRSTLFGAALLATGLVAGHARAVDPLVIGVLNDQSGAYADLGGKGSVVAVEMAVADFGGTVLGRPLQVISADHGNKPDTASAIASRWFDEGHVGLITDMTFSSAAIAIQHVAQQRGKITIDTGAATTSLIQQDCSPTGFMWAFNTYTNATGTAGAVLARGGDTWSLIVADYAFGKQLASDTAALLDREHGKLINEQLYSFGSSDLSSFLLTAQGSGAKVVGLATGGSDMVTAITQAHEFGIMQNQKVAALGGGVFDFHAIGLEKAQGLLINEAFYWDRNDESRAFAKRYEAKFGRIPGTVQVASYSAVLHYLKAVAAAGTDDGPTVARKMREMPVDDVFVHGGHIRADGWLMHDFYLFEVKTPAESKGPYDIYKVVATIPAETVASPLAGSKCPLVAATQ